MAILHTSRLSLSELAVANAPFILELVNSPGWLAFIGDRGIKDIPAAENYILNGPMKSYASVGYGLYLVTLTATATPIGICGLIKRDYLEHADIGFAQLPQYSGHGYALEAAAAVGQFAKDALGLQKIQAITKVSNQRSIQLLTKIGLSFEKMIQQPGGEELMLFSS